MGLKKCVVRAGGYCILLAGVTSVLLPFAWMLFTSLKPSREALTMPPKCFPSVTMWENYVDARRVAPFAVYFSNNAMVSLAIMAGELVTTTLVTYAFFQMDFKGRDALFVLLVAAMMAPRKILTIPNHVTLAGLGWINTYGTLILPWCASVFSIFLLKQQFSSIPAAYYKATRIDGYRRFRYLVTAMIPMSKSTIVTIALLKLVNNWNSYMWPLIVTNINEVRTLSVAPVASSIETDVQYNMLIAFSFMIIPSILLVYSFTRKYTIRGVSSIGLKG